MTFIMGRGYDRVAYTIGSGEQPRKLTEAECDELDARDRPNELGELMDELDRRLGPLEYPLKYPAGPGRDQ